MQIVSRQRIIVIGWYGENSRIIKLNEIDTLIRIKLA
jgi:hypothetical protein